MRTALQGAGLTLLVTLALVLALGWSAMMPGLVMGAAATGIELVALRWLRKGVSGSTREALWAFGAGLAIRFLGIGLFAMLVLWDRGLFPPLATGLGYVGVVVPLLFLETRSIR